MRHPEATAGDRSTKDDAIQQALTIGGGPQQLRQHYEKWAPTYNEDVSCEDYCAPATIVNILVELSSSSDLGIDIRDPDIRILDAGCGTGLVGIALAERGYRHISGCDLSPSMIEIAGKIGVYEDLKCDVDLTKRNDVYPGNEYDVVLCCGAFTTGHLPPDALEELMRMVTTGGVLLVSVRKSYYEAANFSAAFSRLEQESETRIIYQLLDGPYLAEEGAAYFAFRVA